MPLRNLQINFSDFDKNQQLKLHTPEEIPNLSGRVYIVTGGTSGIGCQTVTHLVAHNAKVYVGARSEAKATETFNKIREHYPKADLNLLLMDLVDLKSVKHAAEDFLGRETKLHVLINNAGIAVTPYKLTNDGFEAQFQTNYLSHWLLTYLLLPTITKTSAAMAPHFARVINVSSDGHKYFAPKAGINLTDVNLSSPSISPWKRYGQSKLAGILHIKALNDKYGPRRKQVGTDEEASSIWTASVHPGSVDTGLLTDAIGFGVVLNFLQPMLRFFGSYISPEQGCWTSIYVATSDEALKEEPGNYFEPFGKKGKPSRQAGDKKLEVALWEWTESELKTRQLI